MMCKILLPDRSNKAIFVNSYTTVQEAFADVASRVNLTQHSKYFSLFEYDEQQGMSMFDPLTIFFNIVTELSRPLSDNEYVCDILATFDKEKQGSKLVLRRRIFNEDPERILDQENVSLIMCFPGIN